jgi:adenylate cyclase
LVNERLQRRLATILAADVVGFSSLMERDEEGTYARVGRLRRELIEPCFSEHQGRLIKTTGDGFLGEFSSSISALRCAIAIQSDLSSDFDRLPMRIGLNLGDIIVEDGGDVFGEGVNVAARLEALCDPGGILISAKVYGEVDGKVEAAFEDRGEQQVKNISRPVHTYAVRPVWMTRTANVSGDVKKPLQLPDRPSIAVLPFQNMSGDPEQEYFADGMVEDIITALSRFKSLFVIARNSSFTYKGKAVDIRQVGRELGVRYVLEGSVRKSGNRVRINGQLIEAATGSHLWAEKIDGALEDIFTLQDEVTTHVVGAIAPTITQAEINRAQIKPTSNLDAYDCFLRALPPLYKLTRENNDVAVGFMRQAIQLDPQYHLAKALLAFNYLTRWLHGWGEAGDKENGLALAREAIADDGDNSSVLRWAGHTLGFWDDSDRALFVLEKAARLNANGAQELSSLGWVMNYACVKPDITISHFERAIRLSPRDPEVALMLGGIAMAHLIAGRGADALAFAQKSIDEMPRYLSSHRVKIASLVGLGRLQEAKAAAAVLLAYDPKFAISTRLPKYRDDAFQKRYYDGLKAAGLPE